MKVRYVYYYISHSVDERKKGETSIEVRKKTETRDCD